MKEISKLQLISLTGGWIDPVKCQEVQEEAAELPLVKVLMTPVTTNGRSGLNDMTNTVEVAISKRLLSFRLL